MLLVMIMFIAWLLDNTFGWSYYYGTGNKITKVTKIQTVLNSPNLDSNTKSSLISLQHDVMNRKGVKDYIFLSFRNISATNSNVSQVAALLTKVAALLKASPL